MTEDHPTSSEQNFDQQRLEDPVCHLQAQGSLPCTNQLSETSIEPDTVNQQLFRMLLSNGDQSAYQTPVSETNILYKSLTTDRSKLLNQNQNQSINPGFRENQREQLNQEIIDKQDNPYLITRHQQDFKESIPTQSDLMEHKESLPIIPIFRISDQIGKTEQKPDQIQDTNDKTTTNSDDQFQQPIRHEHFPFYNHNMPEFFSEQQVQIKQVTEAWMVKTETSDQLQREFFQNLSEISQILRPNQQRRQPQDQEEEEKRPKVNQKEPELQFSTFNPGNIQRSNISQKQPQVQQLKSNYMDNPNNNKHKIGMQYFLKHYGEINANQQDYFTKSQITQKMATRIMDQARALPKLEIMIEQLDKYLQNLGILTTQQQVYTLANNILLIITLDQLQQQLKPEESLAINEDLVQNLPPNGVLQLGRFLADIKGKSINNQILILALEQDSLSLKPYEINRKGIRISDLFNQWKKSSVD